MTTIFYAAVVLFGLLGLLNAVALVSMFVHLDSRPSKSVSLFPLLVGDPILCVLITAIHHFSPIGTGLTTFEIFICCLSYFAGMILIAVGIGKTIAKLSPKKEKPNE